MDIALASIVIFKMMIWFSVLAALGIALFCFRNSRTRSGTVEASFTEAKVSLWNVPIGVVCLLVAAALLFFGLWLAPEAEYSNEENGTKTNWRVEHNPDEKNPAESKE